ncbi:S-adenosyl-L-methionine-dependent methyltransferase [Mycena capillaripes]|nr:S-adenosyl-L-methionine-dependent methyltransferase [Mycena capillaripes]
MSPTISESGLAEFVALANLISRTVKDILEEYSAAGVSMPSLFSLAPGPFDAPNTLSFSVGSPGHVVISKCFGFSEPTCMLIATDAKIADLLNKPDGVHVDDLVSKTGINAGKLSRVLRLLPTKHCFAEVKPNVFANNRLSVKLFSSDPVSDAVGLLPYVAVTADELGKSHAALNEILNDSDTTASVLPEGSTFNRTHGCTFFEFYTLFWQPDQKELQSAGPVYPCGALLADTVVCDVGGGNGLVTMELLRAFPQLKIVVQDLPPVVEQGREFLEYDASMNSELKQRVHYVPLNFFAESPVRECDVHYIRHALHNLPAEECKQILDNIRKVAKPSSKLFVHESVTVRQEDIGSPSEEIFEKAPGPLLPNFGVGRERMLSQFVGMAALSGFEFVKLWDLGEVGLMESIPRK